MGIFGFLKGNKKKIEKKVREQVKQEVNLEQEMLDSTKDMDVSVKVDKEIKRDNSTVVESSNEINIKSANVEINPEAESLAEGIVEKQEEQKQQDQVDQELGIEKSDIWSGRKTDVNKYVAGLSKSRQGFSGKINSLLKGKREFDDEFFEELENILIMNDVSMNMVISIIDEIKKEITEQQVESLELIKEIIADKMFVIYSNWSHINTTLNVEDDRLNVVLMVGVNGAGKTTTIAKLANNLIQEGKKVMVAAGDTFRAGAIAQLGEWADRLGIECVAGEEGGDPASVIFDALKKAKEENVDVLICDTAGRLQNKVNLMNELNKINRIIQREVPEAPHETLLVIDATTGQNGVSQAKNFTEVATVSGIVLSKMDGTSKGGIILSVKDELDIPVKFMGLGEKVTDLEEFDLEAYIYGLTKDLMD